MVFSASSTTSLLGESGDSAYYLKRTVALRRASGSSSCDLLAGAASSCVRPLHAAAARRRVLPAVAVLLPGRRRRGQRRASAGSAPASLQIQPSELMKVALVLYGAQLLATRPKMVRELGDDGAVPRRRRRSRCALVVVEPDLGTAHGRVLRDRGAADRRRGAAARHRPARRRASRVVVLLAVLIEPYRMERLTGFLHPGADPGGAGFQAIQAKIALGSGGIFGVGLGESLQKAFYLPEAHTDMIAAVIGEELGLLGIGGLVGLYGLFGYAGLRIAQRARDRYGKLLAAGLTSLVLVQARDQPLRRARARAAHRRAAAVRLLRQLEHAGDAGRASGCCSTSHEAAAPARRASRRAPVGDCASSTAAAATARAPATAPARSARAVPQSRDSGGRNSGTRRPGAGRRRRASG